MRYAPGRAVGSIVYWGPGLGGKTTNLRHLRACVDQRRRGRLVVLDPRFDPDHRLEFMPLDLGVVGGLHIRLNLYTVPGRLTSALVRRRLLRTADGVVFVADSAGDRIEATAVSWLELSDELSALGREPGPFPTVMQYNKRDLPGAVPLEQMEEELNPLGLHSHPAIALNGVGVADTFRAVARQIAHGLALDIPAAKAFPAR